MSSTESADRSSLMTWVRGAGLTLVRQLAKFGVVGLFAFIVDVGIFNLLLHAGDAPPLEGQPLLAKVISTAAATVVAWLGNRYWTFRHTRRPHMAHELAIYTVVCTIGLGLAVGCLWFSHYVLGYTSALADNIAANVVGLAIASTFRFWAYGRFVFTHEIADEEAAEAAPAQPQLTETR